MTDKPLSDHEILDRAVSKLGSQAAVAARFERSPQSFTRWKKDGIPSMVRRALLADLQLEKVPWMAEDFQQKHRATKALQQVVKLFYRTKTEGAEWARLEELLDRLQPWGEKEWHDTWERKLDWITEPGSVPMKRRVKGGSSA